MLKQGVEQASRFNNLIICLIIDLKCILDLCGISYLIQICANNGAHSMLTNVFFLSPCYQECADC